MGIDFLPNKYWFIAVPTHFFVTLIYIFILIKAYNYYITIDEPIKEGKLKLTLDVYYKLLSKNELLKEIKYDMKEGIVPDTGDIPEDIVNEVLAMNINKKNN